MPYVVDTHSVIWYIMVTVVLHTVEIEIIACEGELISVEHN
jgi:hypothetical protein